MFSLITGGTQTQKHHDINHQRVKSLILIIDIFEWLEESKPICQSVKSLITTPYDGYILIPIK
jgi:hypothetical protein